MWISSFLSTTLNLSAQDRGDTASRWKANWSLQHHGTACLQLHTCTCTATELSKSSTVFFFPVRFRMLPHSDVFLPLISNNLFWEELQVPLFCCTRLARQARLESESV